MRNLSLKSRWFLLTVGAIFVAEQPILAYAAGDDCAMTCATAKQGMVGDAHSLQSDHQVDGQTYSGAHMSWGFALTVCGPPPSASANTPGGGMSLSGTQHSDPTPQPSSTDQAPDTYHSGDTDWDNCFALLTAEWSQVAPDCAAIDAANQGHMYDFIAAIAYSAAAGLCAIACAAQSTGYGALLNGVCAIAGAAGTIADITGIVQLNDTGVSDGTAYLTAIGGGAATLTSLIVMIAQLATKQASQSAAARVASCLSAAVFLGVALVKWLYALPTMDKTANDACTDLKSLGTNPFQAAYNAHAGISGVGGPSGSGTGTTTSSTGDTSKKGKSGTTSTPAVPAYFTGDVDFTQFPPPGMAAATAGGNDPAMKLFQNMPGMQQKLPEALKAMGTDVNDFAKKVAEGGPVSAIGAMSGADDNVKSLLTQAESAVKDALAKNPNLGGVPSSTMTGGGGGAGKGKAASKASPFGDLFGAKTPAGGAPSSADFDKQKKKDIDPSEGGDIWHDGYAGSIFQIVSHRLGKTTERVEQLEWTTPLNRALAGLPNKSNKVSNHGGGK